MDRSGDTKLFRPVERRRFLQSQPPCFSDFGWAYWESARALAGDVSKPLDSGSLLALPIVFLYRHAVEMYLKGILIEFGADLGICKNAVVDRQHCLTSHLPDINRLANSAGMQLSQDFSTTVNQLETFDPKSMHCRYPEAKDGKELLSERQRAFDLEQVVSGVESVLDELAELVHELEQDYYRQMIDEAGISN